MGKQRKLFCELHPITYKIAVLKEQLKRWLKNRLDGQQYAKSYQEEQLPVKVYKHQSLIRRTLGNVDATLQSNKAKNLEIASKKVSHIIIRPGETFSFWSVVGRCSKRKGYLEGLIIKGDDVDRGIGGGMCQFTNLVHWMVLHSPLDIVEHHHHNGFDLFPDYNRQVPFGTGTSIMYNYLDYRFENNTDNTFQLIVYTDEKYLCGELRAMHELEHTYHIVEENAYFSSEGDNYYRNNEIYRRVIDKTTGNLEGDKQIITSHAKVMYDPKLIKGEIRAS